MPAPLFGLTANGAGTRLSARGLKLPERIEVHSTRSGARDFIEVPTRDEALIEALLRERRGYAIRGKADRVAAVEAELEKLGWSAPPRKPGRPPRV